jgi:hypothetical protein
MVIAAGFPVQSLHSLQNGEAAQRLFKLSSPHFSRPVRNAHRVPTFVGVSRESFRPGKPHPKRLATDDLLTNRRICEKVRLAPQYSRRFLQRDFCGLTARLAGRLALPITYQANVTR